MNPDHLIEHARRELGGAGRGAPRQADLHRAVSTAYYAIFHALCEETVIAFAPKGEDSWSWGADQLFLRSHDHGKARKRCKELSRVSLGKDLISLFHRTEFEPKLRSFADKFGTMQEQRHRCDYDPGYKISKAHAAEFIEMAEQGIRDLRSADKKERGEFLAYILLGARG